MESVPNDPSITKDNSHVIDQSASVTYERSAIPLLTVSQSSTNRPRKIPGTLKNGKFRPIAAKPYGDPGKQPATIQSVMPVIVEAPQSEASIAAWPPETVSQLTPIKSIRKKPRVAPMSTYKNIKSNSKSNIINSDINTPLENVNETNTNEEPDTLDESDTQECIQLYDPCTKEPIENIQALEKRIREIKQQKNKIPIGLYGLTNKTSNYDFLLNVFLNPSISLDDMVSFKLEKGSNAGSDIFEVLSRLFVFFGGIKNVDPRKDGNYQFMKKIEGRTSEIYNDSINALRSMSCKASRVMGISDITLINVRKDTQEIKPDSSYCEVECDITTKEQVSTYVMSVKWYKEEKNAEHYDLEKLFVAANRIVSPEQKPVDIIVFLKSKKDFHIAHNRAARQYVKELANTYFGWDEDVKPFLEEIRSKIFESSRFNNNTPQQEFEKGYISIKSKPSLSLQLHQDIIVKGICDKIEEQVDPLYIIGVLPRGGKTYIAGGIIREYVKRTQANNINVIWLTAAPNETLTQVNNDLLLKYQDFDNFEFIEVKNNANYKKTKPDTVFFCSTQLLVISNKKQDEQKRQYLHNLLTAKDQLSIVFFDEAHKTGTGEQTKKQIESIINTYRNTNLPLIFLSATYYNILIDYQIQKTNTYIWDYTDVLSARRLATTAEQSDAIKTIEERFDKELVNSIIEKRKSNGETIETMAKAYIDYPDLYFISADFQQEAIQRFEEQNVYRPNQGFSLKTIFAINPNTSILDIKTPENKIRKDAYRIFVNLINPKNIISLITPRDTFVEPDILEIKGGEPFMKEKNSTLEPSILGRIDKISRDTHSRFRLDEQPTILMFMPIGGEGTNIFYLLCAWASLLLTHKWWKENYEIACIVDEENIVAESATLIESSNGIHIINKNPKSNIITLERRLHCQEQPKGLLILSGDKLSMGVSLPCTDVVFLLNEKKSPDDIIQKMYRALTPSPGKQAAFIVDLNPVRTLAALYGYTRVSHESTNTASEILDIIYDTYSWDSDVFEYNIRKGPETRLLTFHDKLRQMYEQAERDPDYRIHDDIGGLEKKIAENIRKGLDSDTIHQLIGQIGDQKMSDIARRMGLENGTNMTLKNGRMIIRKPKEPLPSDTGLEEKKDDKPDTVEIVIENFVETVIDFIKYIAITSTADRLEKALEEYERNQINDQGTTLQHNVIHMIRSRTNIKNNTDDVLLSSILVSTVKSTLQSSERIFRQMKGKVNERSVRKDKIIAIINKRLTPRQKQKKDHGEVFTPIEMIENMLAHLPNTDWSNPDLKWLDPANGIGNFPVVVFYKLDEGLKKWEPNEKIRRKHIIENMIFMMELQSNNNRIARNIFTSLCENCTPNIWTVDTLKQSNEAIHTHFNVKQFDRIIGNPPFQAFQEADGKRGGGDELYMKFVKKSLELLVPNGYLVFVHPPSWRKPEYTEGQKKSKNAGMFTLMAHDHQMVYLEIHDANDGRRDFKAGTRYDIYVIKNTKATKETIINDMNRTEIEVDLRDFEFLPNFNFKNVKKLFPNRQESLCELGEFDEKTGKYINTSCVLYERSAYGSDKSWVHAGESSNYKYPLIHSTLKDGARLLYSSRNDKGMFGIPKVIFGESGVNEPVIDMDGIYGMTQGAMAIIVKSKTEAIRLNTFLKSNFFKNILESCKYGGFRIDWRLFTYFKENFWDIDVPLNEELTSTRDDDEVQQGRKRFTKTRKNRKE